MGNVRRPFGGLSLIVSLALFTFIAIKASTSGLSAPAVVVTEITPATCSDAADGSIDISISGVTGEITYTWVKAEDPGFSSDLQDPGGLSTGTYTVVVEGDNGPASSGPITVGFTDNQDPIIQGMPVEVRVTLPQDSCEAKVEWIAPTVKDNCSGSRIEQTSGPAKGSLFGAGKTEIIYTATDASGNTATASFYVFVEDRQAPQIAAKTSHTVVLDEQGAASLLLSQVLTAESTDNCGIASQTLSRSTFSCADVSGSPIPVTLTVTDVNGVESNAVIDVSVVDDIAPVVNALASYTIVLDENGLGTMTPADVIDSSTDACGIASEELTRSSFSCADIAASPVIVDLVVTDNNSNKITKQVSVNVVDNLGPAITAAPIDVPADQDQCYATVAMTATAQDACATISLKGTRSDGKALTESYPLGTTEIYWIATDSYNNQSRLTQTVRVTDQQKPVINPVAVLEPLPNTPGACSAVVDLAAPAVSDNCDTAVAVAFREDGLAMTAPFPVGTTVVHWNYTDQAGNKADTVNQLITVLDKEAPASPVLPDLWSSCAITVTPPTTTDNCSADAEIEVTTEDPTTYLPQNNITEYSITWKFTDKAGNFSTAVQKLTINPLITNISITNVTCNGGNNGSIEVQASGGRAAYTYSLNGAAYGSSSSFYELTAGSYTVSVKDDSGCVVTKNVEVIEPESLSFNQGTGEATMVSPESCYGASDGSIRINGTLSGGNGNYEFSVDNVNFSANPITGLSAGTYEIFIQDTNGCRLPQILSATVPGPPDMTATVKPNSLNCYNSYSGSIKINNAQGGNGAPYSFRINGGPWQSTETSLGHNFTGLAAGNYVVEMKDVNGCIKKLDTLMLTEPNQLQVSVSTERTTVYGAATGSATANPVGGNGTYTYQWRNAAGNIIGNTKTITGLQAGSYEVTVTDAQQCTATKEFQIFDALKAEISAVSICESSDDIIRTSTFQVDLDHTFGGQGDPIKYTYTWDFGEGASLPDGTTGIGPFEVTYSGTGDKLITLMVKDEGGSIRTFTFNHYVGECFEECDSANNFSSDPNSFYIGDALGNKMSVNDCSMEKPMYLWFIVDKSSNGYKLTTEFVYTVTRNGITRQYQTTNCFSNADGSQLQAGQLVRLNPIGPDEGEIHWNCDEILNIIHITYRWTSNANKACGDTNNNHCASTNETMSVAAPIRGTADAFGTCFGQNNGSIIVYAYGGTGTFVYKAVNTTTGITYGGENHTNNVFNNLPAGNYTVTVTDSKDVALDQERSFLVIEDLIITQAGSELSATVRGDDISCFGAKDGTASVLSTSGGTPPYTYLWNDPMAQIGPKAENLGPGTYTVTITDDLGCTVNKSVEITQPAELTIANAGPDQTRCGFTTTNLEANTATSGIGKWTLISEPVAGSGVITDLSDPNSSFSGVEGTYVLEWTIASAEGKCPTSDRVSINIISDCNFLDFDGVDDYVHAGNNYGFESGSFSVETWIKLESTSSTRTVISKRDNANPSAGYELVVSAGGVPTFKMGGKSISANSSVLLNTQRWYHLAVTFDGSTAKLYVDGLQVNSQSVNAPGSTSAPFLIGATYDSSQSRRTKSGSHHHGWIEELRLWKKALSPEQIRFMMNQRLEKGVPATGASLIPVKGEVLPMNVPGPLYWSDLSGYYQLLALKVAGDGTTADLSDTPVRGVMKNITTLQENTAPLPYVSKTSGNWRDIETSSTPWKYGRGLWDAPNSLGINQQPINWNIVKVSHDITSGNKDITVLGLISEKNELSMENPNYYPNERNPGHFLRVTHYLELDGVIDLVGESQLLQDEGSILADTSSGYLERDQQGTASSYNYNYWSSPVSGPGAGVNGGYTVGNVLWDGTNTREPLPIAFGYRYAHADGAATTPIKISTYWLNKFYGEAGKYSQWSWIGKDGPVATGQGFTMKGSQGVSVTSRKKQNYVFRGLPNNGDINLEIVPGTNYLVGNPYPSAIDADEFIKDNLAARSGTNIFNGSLYFWSHFSGQTHYLERYVGGYATYNLSGGVRAAATDARIKATGESGGEEPKRFIPVGQAFFVNTVLDDLITNWSETNPEPVEIVPGEVKFRNSQRIFQREHVNTSVFHTQEEKAAKSPEVVAEDQRKKIWIKSVSPMGYHRQLLLTADPEATYDFDLGYDAPLLDNLAEDMYWTMHQTGFVIQGVPGFDKEQEIPLAVKVEQEGSFRIGIDKLENVPDDFEIHLKDSLTPDLTHDLRQADFEFAASPGEITGRFAIVFLNEEQQAGPDETEKILSSITAFYVSGERQISILNPNQVSIRRGLLYSMSGQQLEAFSSIPSDQEVRLPVDIKTSGIYILRLETELGKKSVKFIIR